VTKSCEFFELACGPLTTAEQYGAQQSIGGSIT
jgi:hypothetical protein